MASKTLLVVAHAPSRNTQKLLQSVEAGARSIETAEVQLVIRTPFEANAGWRIKSASRALVLGTTENLGYMVVRLKIFDRIYNPCLEVTAARRMRHLYARASTEQAHAARSNRLPQGLVGRKRSSRRWY